MPGINHPGSGFSAFWGLPFCLLWIVSAPAQATLSQLESDFFDQMHYRHIGPLGNRFSAVTGEPGNPNVYYVGAASGGIFKSEDGGAHWQPIFDEQPVASIGSLALAPSDPNLLWAGTGETFIRSNVSIGNGIYKSTDGGKTWQHKGLEKTGRIGRIIIHPTNPEIVYAASMGHCYGPQEERGVYRTKDGGESWARVLFVDQNTGASDIVMDPNNPRILFAGLWQMVIWTWGRESGGPGSGLHVSRDGGDSWEQLSGNGLPKGPIGKIGLSMSADNSDRVYALIETSSNSEFHPVEEHPGVLWRSDDGGHKWSMVNADHALAQRPLYYSRAAAAPDDENEIHFMSTRYTRSLDGGATTTLQQGLGGDFHDMWIDPELPNRMITGHDQGISISNNRGKSWFRPQLPVAQLYHAHTDNRIPYYVYGNRQDGPSTRGPSNNLTNGPIPIGAWRAVGGCESGFSIPDPNDENFVWSGCYEGILDRHNLTNGQTRNVSVWPDNPEGWAAADLRYRFQWTFPIAFSPHTPNQVYVGSQHLHTTTDNGQSWRVISPDLSLNDKTKLQKTGGLTLEDVSPTYFGVLFAIAESPLEAGVIWAGTNDGQLQITRDGGQNWKNLTPNIPDLPPYGTVSNIEPSRHHSGTSYISIDLHQVGNFDPFIYKTTDYGQSWQKISDTIPSSVFSSVHVVREDPQRPGLLFAGTENSLYVSFSDGQLWHSLQSDLPHAPVYWLTIQPHFSDLVVATYGRGFWILDDITPLRQLAPTILDAKAHLFAPRPTYRFRMREAPMIQPDDPAAGTNPEYGVPIHFFLKEASENITLTISDSEGKEVRVIKPAEDQISAGLNRLYWDLRHEKSKEPELRTAPLQHSHVRIPDQGWRKAGDGRQVAPLALPGNYSVQLRASGLEMTQTLTIRKDPNSIATDGELREQAAVLQEIKEHTNAAVEIINALEWVRRQLDDLKARLSKDSALSEIVEKSSQLEKQLMIFEANFFDLRLTGGNAGQDTIRYPRRLYAKLTSLFGYIDRSDGPPTNQHLEVLESYREQLSAYQEEWSRLKLEEIQPFNNLLRTQGISILGSNP